MNEQKRNETDRYFQEQTCRYAALSQELNRDHRVDEVVFAKVQGNVYDIFSAVFSAAVKTCGQDDEKAVQFFLTKLQQIPQNWHTALATATEHGETEKAYIEQLKLDTATEIQNEFLKIWEVTA